MDITKKDKMNALKESFIDCVVGGLINAPLNYVLIYIAFYYEFTALLTTIWITSVIFIVALCRKYHIRLVFLKNHRKRKAKFK